MPATLPFDEVTTSEPTERPLIRAAARRTRVRDRHGDDRRRHQVLDGPLAQHLRQLRPAQVALGHDPRQRTALGDDEVMDLFWRMRVFASDACTAGFTVSTALLITS